MVGDSTVYVGWRSWCRLLQLGPNPMVGDSVAHTLGKCNRVVLQLGPNPMVGDSSKFARLASYSVLRFN